MKSATEVRRWAQKKIPAVFHALVRPEALAELFPLRCPLGVLPKEYSTLRSEMVAFQEMATSRPAKSVRRDPTSDERTGQETLFEIETEKRITRKWGEQTLPRAVVFHTADPFLRFVAMEGAAKLFQACVTVASELCEPAAEWAATHPSSLLQHLLEPFPRQAVIPIWREILQVILLLQQNHKPGIYLREIPVPVHTKFVEEHRSLFRLLWDTVLPERAVDRTVSSFLPRYGFRSDPQAIRFRWWPESPGWSDLSVPLEQFVRFAVP